MSSSLSGLHLWLRYSLQVLQSFTEMGIMPNASSVPYKGVIIASPFSKGVSIPMNFGLCVSLSNLMIRVFGLFLSISIFCFPFSWVMQELSWLAINVILNLFYVFTFCWSICTRVVLLYISTILVRRL